MMRVETTHQMKGKARGPSEKPFEAVAPKEPVYVLLGCINVDTGNAARRLRPQLIGA